MIKKLSKFFLILFLKIIKLILYIVYTLCIHGIDKIDDFIEKKTGKNFEKKYDDKALWVLSMQIPLKTKINYPNVKKLFPKLSKRQCYKVIELSKVK